MCVCVCDDNKTRDGETNAPFDPDGLETSAVSE